MEQYTSGYDDPRERLLAVGLRHFATMAYDEVSVDTIAAEAGLPREEVRRHFAGKRELYVAVVRRGATDLVAALKPDPSRSNAENARVNLRRFLTFVSDHADAFLALSNGGFSADPEVYATLELARTAIADQVLGDAGLDHDEPTARIAARSWLAGVEAGAVEWLRRRDLAIDALVDVFSASLFAHMLAAARIGGGGGGRGLDVVDGLPLLSGLLWGTARR